MVESQKIIGHADTVSFCKQLVAAGNFPSAFLLAGPPMVGKTKIVEAVVRQLLCENKNSCGQCKSCTTPLDVHSDVLQYNSSEVDKDSEDKSQLKILSSLLQRVYQRPVLGNCLVVILNNVDEYNVFTSQVLLKFLEDSPAYVKFIITASSIDAVLPTIRSRSLVRQIRPLFVESLKHEIADWLQNDPSMASTVNDDTINRVALLSGGRPGLAMRLMADEQLFEQYDRWYRKLFVLSSMPIGERSAFADKIDKQGAASEIITLLQSILREKIIVSGGEKKMTTALRRSRESAAMIKANVPPRLALEYLFFTQSIL